MKTALHALPAWLLCLAAPMVTWAQYRTPEQQQQEAAAACAACGGCFFVIAASGAVLLVLHIVTMIWVMRDAQNRGMDTPVIWLLILFFFPLIGFIVYFFVRPGGALVRCPHCPNKRLQASAKCPHCGQP